MPPEIDDHFDRLKQLYGHAAEIAKMEKVDDEIKAHFVYYLCVLTSGYIETSIKTILREYMQSRMAPEAIAKEAHITEFVEINMKRILNRTFNPNYNNILNLLAEFSNDWKDNIKRELHGELSDALDSIVSNRNNIVHGGSSELTLRNLQNYFEKAQKAINLIYEELSGHSRPH